MESAEVSAGSTEADAPSVSTDDESPDFFDLSEPDEKPVPPPYDEPEEVPVYKKPEAVKEPEESWGEDEDDEKKGLR